MTRAQTIANIKACAAAGDMKGCTRLFIESRLSRGTYDQAVADGRALGAFVAKRDATNAAGAPA